MSDTYDCNENLPHGEKELIWVRSDVAKQIKKLTEPTLKEQALLHSAEMVRRGIEQDTRQLEDDVLKFKAQGLGYRAALTEAWDKECDLLEQAFNKYDARITAIRKQIAQAVSATKPLVDELDRVEKQIDGAIPHKIERLLTVCEKARNLYGEERDMMMTLLQAYTQANDDLERSARSDGTLQDFVGHSEGSR